MTLGGRMQGGPGGRSWFLETLPGSLTSVLELVIQKQHETGGQADQVGTVDLGDHEFSSSVGRPFGHVGAFVNRGIPFLAPFSHG